MLIRSYITRKKAQGYIKELTMNKDYDFIKNAVNLKSASTTFELFRFKNYILKYNVLKYSFLTYGLISALIMWKAGCFNSSSNVADVTIITNVYMLLGWVLIGVMWQAYDPTIAFQMLDVEIDNTLAQNHIIIDHRETTKQETKYEQIYYLYEFAILCNKNTEVKNIIKRATKLQETVKILNELDETDIDRVIDKKSYIKIKNIYDIEQDKLIEKLYLCVKPNISKLKCRATKLGIEALMEKKSSNELMHEQGDEIVNKLNKIK